MKIRFPIVCPKCRHSQSVLFSKAQADDSVSVRQQCAIDRRTIGIVGKSLQAVYRTLAKLHGLMRRLARLVGLPELNPRKNGFERQQITINWVALVD